jgi:hypothetical protein
METIPFSMRSFCQRGNRAWIRFFPQNGFVLIGAQWFWQSRNEKINNHQTVARFFMMENKMPKVDIGLAVRQKLSEQGVSIALLARKLNCDRGNLHKHLQKKHIYPELLQKISAILKTDFFAHYSQHIGQTDENEPDNALM